MRGLLWAALVAGGSYCLVAWFGWQGPATIAWKGAGVALLAAWAASEARDLDGWLIAIVLALGAAGDVLLEATGMIAGAAAFLAGHLVAIGLYLRHRRTALTPSQRALGWLIAPATVVISVALVGGGSDAVTVGIYAAILGLMAAMAWTSRFPRYRTGLGAMLFVASDLLIFARFGPLAGSFVPTVLVWPFYFAGQALIAIGVVGALSVRSARDG
ncbi:lysoplasmalogenase family protein [Hephaestia sp. GCM10023244]|uniref:lysoplasmalogenase family protein n=1 Tax=unclassified Hephaestia TaxID=2631281 RepID=UPI002076D831|nr:lysoplasmalogenase family protein [Hephaestia sp. MAHUQ-44]MCM8730016.1 lysoplasmalogenase [Hephaestia sp. MAHUQ-44]